MTFIPVRFVTTKEIGTKHLQYLELYMGRKQRLGKSNRLNSKLYNLKYSDDHES